MTGSRALRGHEPSALALPDDRSRLMPMAPGRLWIQDLGPLDGPEPAGPPILFLHSLLVTGWDFRFLADSLAGDGRRVLCPDLFGCGNSDRPAPADAAGYGFRWHAELLARMLDRLRVTEIDLVGHGYGGAIAIHLAHRLGREHHGHSAKVRRLSLLAPHCVAVDRPIDLPLPIPLVRRAWRWVGFAPLVFRTVFRRADLRSFLRRSLARPELLSHEDLRDDVDVYWDRLCRDGGLEAVEAMLRQLDALHRRELDGVRDRLEAAMRGLDTPTMVVWGDRDAIVPRRLAERVTRMLPGAELRIIEACGHAPQREQPLALRRTLDSFERRMSE